MEIQSEAESPREDPSNYRWYCVLVPERIAAGGRVYVWASTTRFADGALLLVGPDRNAEFKEEEDRELLVCFAHRNWISVFKTAKPSGKAIAADKWPESKTV